MIPLPPPPRMRFLASLTAFVASLILSACNARDNAKAEAAGTPTVASASASATTTPTANVTAAPSPTDSLVARADRSRILGDSTAPLWVLIVSDFQCPFCKVWHDQTFATFKREFVDKGLVRVAYLNLPLPQHQHAMATAEMAMCAGAQGKFWEFHEALFATQQTWTGMPPGTPFFNTIIAGSKVDEPSFRECMRNHTMRPLVQADYQRAMDAKVRSTPTFFVGDEMRLEGAVPTAPFRDSVAKAVRAATAGKR
jgi:protein-disulfide isomerase